MKKLILSIIAMVFGGCIFAQVLQFQNPSFEGTPQPHITPPLWTACQQGTTPDTQPGPWGINLPASNGSTYVGLCNENSGNWHEGVSQILGSPMVAGTTYDFFIDLATTNDTLGGITPGCIELQVYANMGGNSGCDESNLVWSSGDIYDVAHINHWVTHLVTFTATQNWTNILFMSHNPGCVANPYIMMDNINTTPPAVFINHSASICNNPATLSTSYSFDHYVWSTGDTTQSVNVSASGTYYVTATLNNLPIVDSIHVILTQPYLNINLGNDTTICGNASIALNAGSGFASYTWNTGATAQSISVQQTGTYEVYALDTANCSYTDTVRIIINPAQSLNLGNDSTLCNYSPVILDASIAFDSYQWSTGATSQTISVNSTGPYYVTATNYMCSVTAVDSIYITFNNTPLANAGNDVTICSGGGIVLNATGGTNYNWSPATGLNCTNCISPTASPSHTTTYTVTVTNSYGCTATDNVTVNVITALISHTNSACGQNNGTATLNISSGSGAYSYLWNTSPAQNTQTAVNLSPGTYSVTATDIINNCNIISSVTINNITGPTLSNVNTVSANCGMNTGSISVSITGGTAPFTYYWNSTPPQPTQTLSNVPPGNYCVTVTDANNCTASICGTVSVVAYPAPDICMVTVDTATNYNVVIWEKPVTTGINQYYIYRETNVTGVYNLIGTQNYSNLSTFADNTSNSLQQSYRYELAINDTCGFTSANSAYHQTIHLNINAGMGGSWNLIWNDYIGYAFSTYNIYRGTNVGNLALLNSVSSNVTSYTDLTPPPGILYYMIEAVRPTGCNPSKSQFASTISNIARFLGDGMIVINEDQSFEIYPNPANDELYVENNFSTKEAFISIYNIEGQLIYGKSLSTGKSIIDISLFAQGMYLIKVNSVDGIAVKKFTKE